ncbi:rhythmically expressed gene 5 protein [Prorops nasuta]|uniref:rhythmically expressed gene 5 protein n=1 Tax=Prorops nasuta TaxID=863751 RepID=UPI0034CD1198
MKGPRTLFILFTGCILSSCFLQIDSSAIPMWEFLSRDEKMSHLYRVFSKQVARYCSDSTRPDCNKNLLVTGIRNLANTDNNLLDKLDPYQRGAKDMIWHALVGSSRFSTRVDYESLFTTDADPLSTSGSDTNGLTEESAPANDYVRPSSQHSGPYLVGPMVIRVYPDGRPVPEDAARPLPKDEDAEELKYSRLPSVEDIQKIGAFYQPKSTRQAKPTRKPHLTRQPTPSSASEIQRRQGDQVSRRNPYQRNFLREIVLNNRGIRYF